MAFVTVRWWEEYFFKSSFACGNKPGEEKIDDPVVSG